MKKPTPRQALACTLGLAYALSTLAQAQPSTSSSATTASPNSTAQTEEGVVTLSPFEVSSESDVGFVPTSSLAGGRLATDLKDTPIAYSVLTREFLDALNLTTQEDAMTWSVGAYRPISSSTDLRFFNFEGGGATVSRGIWSTGALRNFFEFGVDSDTYSMDRIDFARGANALLVGSGALGGKVITLTKRANTERRSGQATAVIGSYGNIRGTFDYNLPLTDKFALRTNVLLQTSETWRELEYDKRHAIHLAATYRPFPRTTLRAEYEYFRNDRLIGSENLGDQVSGWDGVSVVDAPVATITNSDARGLARVGSSTTPYLVYIPGSDAGTIMNWSNTWRSLGGAANANVLVGGVRALSTANLGIAGGRMVGDVYDNSRFVLAEGGSSFAHPGSRDIVVPNSPGVTYDFDDYAFFVEHQQGEHLFFDAGINHAETEKVSEYIVPGGLSTAQIDVNRTLPDGSANPNFLVPYGEAVSRHVHFFNEITEIRAALAAVFNRTRFGDFRIGVIGGRMERDSITSGFTEVFDRDADIRRRPTNDTFRYRYYWNQQSTGLTIPESVRLVDPIAGTTNTYDVDTVRDIFRPGDNRRAETEFTYIQSTLNAKLFDGRLNLLGGVRRDSYKLDTWTLNGNAAAVANDYPADWDGQTAIYRPAAPADYWSLTYVPKNASGVATGAETVALTRPRTNGVPQAQYANDRFRDDYSQPTIDFNLTTVSYGGVVHVLPWLSAFANYAESFNAPISGLTLTGITVPPGQSDGWDAGIRFNLFDGKIVASFSRYGSTQINNSFDSTGQTRKYANLAAANAVGDLSANGMNTRGIALIPVPTFDFQDRKADGFEFEIVANVTKDWRLTCNYSEPNTLTTNQHVDQWSFLNANESTLRQIVLDSGGLIDAGDVATVDLSVPVATRSPDVSAAVTAWNDIQNFKKTNDPTRESVSNLPKFTANIFTDYRFAEGRLKGFRVGGGIQYFSKRVIGNRGGDTIVNPSNPNAAIDDPNVDITTLVYMPSFYTATATFGYQRRLADNRDLIINLAIRNLLNNTDPIYAGANLRPPNGDITRPDRVTVPGGFINQPRRSFTLSTTLTF